MAAIPADLPMFDRAVTSHPASLSLSAHQKEQDRTSAHLVWKMTEMCSEFLMVKDRQPCAVNDEQKEKRMSFRH